MPRSRVVAEYEKMQNDIKTSARRQMAAHGTAGLSLRAIARELDVSAPALYRYFPNLDALITALILDGFNALADALEAAERTLPPTEPRAQLRAALLAYRAWALSHPIDFQLIYGNPIPGYVAPAEVTVPAATRQLEILGRITDRAFAAGQIVLRRELTEIPPSVRAQLARIAEPYGTSVEVLHTCMLGWTRIHGAIQLELFGHTPPVVGDPAAFYEQLVDALIETG
ncbi:MAG: TetR/AcrR family transcriptional regulator [Anaerolineales bacterium]|nr:TetR/AcrR family transcriptional regulator [Anaerolineales bacterium]